VFGLEIQEPENLALEQDAQKVKNPDDVPAQQQAQQSSHNLSFLEAGHKTEQPGGDGNDGEDDADESAHPKVVLSAGAFLFSHGFLQNKVFL